MDASMNLADYYFPMLNSLSSKAKLYLVRKLTDSLLKDKSMSAQSVEEERLAAFRKLAGRGLTTQRARRWNGRYATGGRATRHVR